MLRMIFLYSDITICDYILYFIKVRIKSKISVPSLNTVFSIFGLGGFGFFFFLKVLSVEMKTTYFACHYFLIEKTPNK